MAIIEFLFLFKEHHQWQFLLPVSFFVGERYAYGWTLRLGWLGKSYWLLLYMKDMIQMSNMEKKVLFGLNRELGM